MLILFHFLGTLGKEAALYAGLQHARGELVTVMDVDLQDPPELLVEMKTMLDEQKIWTAWVHVERVVRGTAY